MPVTESIGARGGRFGPDGRDRRRRHRAKVALPVHIRGGVGSLDPFQDVGKTIDVSRDGLLVATARAGYSKGQLLEVTIACAGEPTETDTPQRACVIRVTPIPNRLSYALALEYQKSQGAKASAERHPGNLSMVVRVLVVDSDTREAKLARDLLHLEGYEVVHVSSVKKALNVLRTEIPDVLLAAVAEVDEQELCSIMKANIRLQHIPVILLASSAQPTKYSARYQAGATIRIAAPCAPERLQQVMQLVAPPPSGSPYRPDCSAEFHITGFMGSREETLENVHSLPNRIEDVRKQNDVAGRKTRAK